MAMNALKRECYEARLKNVVWEKTAEQYQDFFTKVMDKCYPSDFISSRTWGNMGDRKNDGYLQSTRTLFAVYAPDAGPANGTVSKMESDYTGGIEHWGSQVDNWVFVHNAIKGLSPPIMDKINELKTRNVGINVTHWPFETIRQHVFTLDEPDIWDLLGSVPSEEDVLEVRYEDIQDILDGIAAEELPSDLDIRPVPANKLQRNNLPPEMKGMLEAGMQKSDLVSGYFNEYHDPMFGDKVVESFKSKYHKLRNMGMGPERIFLELQKYTGGDSVLPLRKQAAVLAVLAYLFEQCEIFERPDDEVS